MEYRITLEENTHGSKSKKSKLKNIIERCMDVFAEPDHKVGETDHLEVNMDLVEDANLKNQKNKKNMDIRSIRGNQLDDEEDSPEVDEQGRVVPHAPDAQQADTIDGHLSPMQ